MRFPNARQPPMLSATSIAAVLKVSNAKAILPPTQGSAAHAMLGLSNLAWVLLTLAASVTPSAMAESSTSSQKERRLQIVSAQITPFAVVRNSRLSHLLGPPIVFATPLLSAPLDTTPPSLLQNHRTGSARRFPAVELASSVQGSARRRRAVASSVLLARTGHLLQRLM